MDILSEIAKQGEGIGYLLFVGSMMVNIYQERTKKELQRKLNESQKARVSDVKETLENNNRGLNSIKESLTTVMIIVKSLENRR